MVWPVTLSPPHTNVLPVNPKPPVVQEYSNVLASVENDPVYSSVHDLTEGVTYPPNANADVVVPAPANLLLAVIKAPPAVHDEPSYSSVHDTIEGVPPPKASPAFCVPAPANSHLAVDKAPPTDHDVPLYSSVHVSRYGGSSPPKASPAFCVPAPAKAYLPAIKAPPADQAAAVGAK